MQNERRNGRSTIWTLDKRISLPIVMALLANMGAGIWFAAGVVSRQDQHDKDIASIRHEQSEIRRLSDKIIRLEVLIENLSDEMSKSGTARKVR